MANLSQEKRKRMLEFLQQIRAEHTDDTSIIAINEIESELTSKKYGLVWEEHTEEVDEQIKHNVPVFTEVPEKAITTDEALPYNFLLEGDNLHSLKLLEKTHKGKIDVIYIDPPYNTGNKDFVYDDTIVGSEDGFKHSKWLSFMYRRLEIAKNLLADNGVIFISINDIEQSQLKLLCDDVFGENNFITTMPKKGSGGRQDSKHFAVVHEYIACYARTVEKYIAGREEKEAGAYPLVDENGSRYKLQLLRKWGDNSLRENRPNLYYPIYYNKQKNTFDIERKEKSDIEIFPMVSDAQEGCWRWGKSTMNDNMLMGKVEIKKKGTTYIPYERLYEPTEAQTKPYTTWIDDIDNNTGSALLKNILGTSAFGYPKPLDLIKKILKMALPTSNYTVLDFFAGSGTTAQAVMELNKQDGGNRRFILCTNNENGICENITYQRIKTVITGKRTDGTEYSEGIPANLKYFKTGFIAKTSEDEDYCVSDKLLEHIAEMVELQHGAKIDGIKHILVLTDEMADGLTEQALADCEQLYVSVSVLLTTEQEQMFKRMGIEVLTIPDYYFESELLEVGER